VTELAPRKPYEAPRLVVSGTLLDLTLGGSGLSQDNQSTGSIAVPST